MDPQPMRKVRDLGRLAERVACRSTVRWSRLWAFLGFCLLAAVVGGPAVDLPRAQSFTVTAPEVRSDQEILFNPVPGTTVGVPIVLTASSRTNGKDSPTGLAVSYTSRNQRVCTVSGATVVPRTGGRCVIIASQEGNAQYLPAKPVGQEFPVARAAQTVTFTPPASATIGQPVILTATTSSWLPVTYTSSTPDVCTVSGAILTPTAAGTCTVVASQPGRPVTLSASATSGLDVSIPAALREAAVRETTNAAKGQLNVDLIGFLVSGWQKHREVIIAARRTVAAPGSIELIDLATHQITATQRPAVNLLVDNRPMATVELGLSVVFNISALVAGIRGGRLVTVHSGRCDVTATRAIEDTKVISRRVTFALPGIIPLGQGIPLLADHGHPGDEAPQASVA